MSLSRAVPVTLAAAERTMLKTRACGVKTAHRDRLRAQIVLAAACGRGNARIAADLRITVDTVRKWRGRFAARGLGGLSDLPSAPGRLKPQTNFYEVIHVGRILRFTGTVVGIAAGLPASWAGTRGLPTAAPGCRLAAWALIRGERSVRGRGMKLSSGLRTGVCGCS